MLHRRVNGHDMAFIALGEGAPLVCVHGSLCAWFAVRLPRMVVRAGAIVAAAPRDRAQPAALLPRALGRRRLGLHHRAACGGCDRLHRGAGRGHGRGIRAAGTSRSAWCSSGRTWCAGSCWPSLAVIWTCRWLRRARFRRRCARRRWRPQRRSQPAMSTGAWRGLSTRSTARVPGAPCRPTRSRNCVTTRTRCWVRSTSSVHRSRVPMPRRSGCRRCSWEAPTRQGRCRWCWGAGGACAGRARRDDPERQALHVRAGSHAVLRGGNGVPGGIAAKWGASVARCPPNRAYRLCSDSERLCVVIGTCHMAR